MWSRGKVMDYRGGFAVSLTTLLQRPRPEPPEPSQSRNCAGVHSGNKIASRKTHPEIDLCTDRAEQVPFWNKCLVSEPYARIAKHRSTSPTATAAFEITVFGSATALSVSTALPRSVHTECVPSGCALPECAVFDRLECRYSDRQRSPTSRRFCPSGRR